MRKRGAQCGALILIAAVARAAGPDAEPTFADAVATTVREQLAAITAQSPTTDTWHDKHTLVSVYRELAGKRSPTPGDLAEATSRLEAILSNDQLDREQRWRIEQLLAEIALGRHLPAEMRVHALRAIDAFPVRTGRADAKRSQLPHLVNMAAEATGLLGGAEAAQRFFVEWLQANPGRIDPAYRWWQDRFREEGQPDRYAAFVRRSMGHPWEEELLQRVQETWTLVAGHSLEELPFRDKNTFASDLSTLATVLEPSPDELRAAEALVRNWAGSLPADPQLAWRMSELEGGIALQSAECERARELYLDALDAYPNEPYPEPLKHSFFQHLLNETAEITWDVRGREAAEAMALAFAARDERLPWLFELWWSARYADEGPDLADAFFSRLVGAYRQREAFFPDRGDETARSIARLETRLPHVVAGDPEKRYFLHVPAQPAIPPGGRGLAVVLPGGDGGAEFRDFVSTWPRALGPDWLVAQLIAPKWTQDQALVWPTRTNAATGMRFPTEEFVAAVVEDVRASNPVDPARIVLIGWSSGGPPVQAAMLAPESVFRKALVVMSVFKPSTLPPLDRARGESWYILHSPEDAICPFPMAEEARNALAQSGARTHLATYPGGHGWNGLPLERVQEAVAWLVSDGE